MEKSLLQRSRGLMFPETNADFDLSVPGCFISIYLKALFSWSSTYLPFKTENRLEFGHSTVQAFPNQ